MGRNSSAPSPSRWARTAARRRRQAARSLLASAALADGGDAVRAVRAGPPGSRLLYATVPVRSPGRTTLLLMNGRLPRGVSDAASLGVAGAVDAACQTQAASGARLAQALLPDGDGPLARLLLGRAGFSRLAELLYLQRQARTRPGPAALPEGFSLARYGPRTHAAFAEAIEASYVDSLDCPALAGLRTIDDVIAGHKAAGLFRPDWWTLILRDGRPAGAMLLAGLGAGGQLGAELVYLGLAPAARGCGLSAPLLARAEAAAATTAAPLLALAVDSNNAPRPQGVPPRRLLANPAPHSTAARAMTRPSRRARGGETQDASCFGFSRPASRGASGNRRAPRGGAANGTLRDSHARAVRSRWR